MISVATEHLLKAVRNCPELGTAEHKKPFPLTALSASIRTPPTVKTNPVAKGPLGYTLPYHNLKGPRKKQTGRKAFVELLPDPSQRAGETITDSAAGFKAFC